MLESICLRILHLIFYLTASLANRWSQLDRQPYPLKAARAKTPSHLALLLVGGKKSVDDAAIVENVAQTISWCQDIGIGKLTIFTDPGNCSTIFAFSDTLWHGTEFVSGLAHLIRTRILQNSADCSEDTDSELEYPLTPPPSDSSDSRPLSPDDHVDLGVTSLYIPGFPTSKRNKRRRQVLTRRESTYISTWVMFQWELTLD